MRASCRSDVEAEAVPSPDSDIVCTSSDAEAVPSPDSDIVCISTQLPSMKHAVVQPVNSSVHGGAVQPVNSSVRGGAVQPVNSSVRSGAVQPVNSLMRDSLVHDDGVVQPVDEVVNVARGSSPSSLLAVDDLERIIEHITRVHLAQTPLTPDFVAALPEREKRHLVSECLIVHCQSERSATR